MKRSPPMKLLFLFLSTFFFSFSFSQEEDSIIIVNEYKEIEVLGDLNKDKVLDKVKIVGDSLSNPLLYKVEIYFGKGNGDFVLVTSSSKILQPEASMAYPNLVFDPNESRIEIKKGGVIWISYQRLRGHFIHKFRFQNGAFELIGFTHHESDGRGSIHSVDFNLMTGLRVESQERYDREELISRKISRKRIRPLPRFEEVEPLKAELY